MLLSKANVVEDALSAKFIGLLASLLTQEKRLLRELDMVKIMTVR